MSQAIKKDSRVTPKPSPRSSRKIYRRFRQVLIGVVAALATIIFERMNAPNWLLITTLVVASVCIAILPAVERGGRAVKRVFWLLVILYSAFAIFVAVGKSQPANIETPTKPPTTQSTPKAGETKEFVNVEPQYFATLYRTHSSAQADTVAHAYIGKWIKITGTVADVIRYQGASPEYVHVVVTMPTEDSWRLYVASATFTEPSAKAAALVLNREERVTVIGKIRGASDAALSLEDCEIVP